MSGLYSKPRWLAARKVIIRRDKATCQMCSAMLRAGRSDNIQSILRPAVVDHLIPHKGDTKLFYAHSNLWLVCSDCHDIECQHIEARAGLTGQQVRAAKISHRSLDIDGTSRTPANRWVDSEYPNERTPTW